MGDSMGQNYMIFCLICVQPYVLIIDDFPNSSSGMCRRRGKCKKLGKDR